MNWIEGPPTTQGTYFIQTDRGHIELVYIIKMIDIVEKKDELKLVFFGVQEKFPLDCIKYHQKVVWPERKP